MYNRVSRGLLIVRRQFRKKLCVNKSTTIGAVCCAATAAIHSAPINYILHRSYSNKDTSDELTTSPPKLLAPDEEAELKLKEFLTVPENERMQKIIELEIEVMRQNSERVPSNLKPRHWFELLNLDSRSKRKRYLSFVWGLEKKKENIQKTKEENQKKHDDEVSDPSEEGTIYKLGSNSMFLRFYDTTINHMWHSRLINKMMFGQQLVLDCGYDSYMTERELKNCAKQLQLTFATNRTHDDPFDLYLCNANLHGNLMKHFHRFIPTLYNADFPLNVKTESYLDIFDKKKLIYLTPHCQQEMNEFDHDAVYIIGAFVDKATNDPVSMAKAKKEGVKMMKFPLDRHLQWGSSSGKNLTINQVLNILLDLRLTGSWEEALKHVPRRKLYQSRSEQLDRKLRNILNSESSADEENYTRPVQELKLKDKFIYKADRSYKKIADYDNRSNTTRDTETNIRQDFTIKSRMKSKNNWKN